MTIVVGVLAVAVVVVHVAVAVLAVRSVRLWREIGRLQDRTYDLEHPELL